jgi:hypothetical protein
VIGHDYKRDAFGYRGYIIELIGGTKQVGRAYKEKIKDVHAFFMGLVAKHVMAYPLHRVEEDQEKSKNSVINYRQGIG